MESQTKGLQLHATQNIPLSGKDRKQNILLTGLPSTGVTVYFTDLMKQDIANGVPTIILDPYGDISSDILSSLSQEQLDTTAYIDVGNEEYPVGLNLLEVHSDNEKKEVENAILNIMYSLFDPKRTGIIGPRFESAVRTAVSTVLYDENSTIVEIVRVLTDQDYVLQLLPKITDPMIKKYWNDQIKKTSDTQKSEILDYVLSKFIPFVTNKRVRNMVGQSQSALRFTDLFMNKNIIIFDFSKLQEDEEAMEISKLIVVFKLFQTIKNRGDKKDLSLYIDQVEDWSPIEMIKLLKNSRRYKINLTLTTQRISTIDKHLRSELLRIGTLLSFRQSTDNAAILAPEFHKGITVDQLCMLPSFHMYLRTLQDGTPVIHEDLDNTKENYEIKEMSNINQIKNRLVKSVSKPISEVEEQIKSRLMYKR